MKYHIPFLTALLLAPWAARAAAPQPNIVLILADDLGWGHVGWQNPKVKTPHLDRLFIFLSDNGAPGQPNRMQVKQDLDSYPKVLLPGDNPPFRGNKGDVYEGGIRTPGVFCWPGKIQPGVCDVPLSVTDWMPTLCALAGCKPPRDLKWDGQDIFPFLTGNPPHPGSRILYCKGPDHASAVTDDPWKLIVTGKTVELYNLTADIGEKNNLAAQHPELVRQLRAKLEIQSADDNDAVPNRTDSP
jgi:arylsulfatase A-like enzyme